MAHLKRVSKSRGNADADVDAEDNAAITQLNYNMPFNNLAPSYESNRNLIALFRCFSFGFAFRLIEIEIPLRLRLCALAKNLF